MKNRGLLGMTLVALSATSFAGPTGLNAMPIADVLGHKELYVSYWGSGTERRISREIADAGAVQLGWGDRMEMGFESDFEGNTYYDLKVSLFEDSEGKWGISGGYMGLRKGESQSYLVGRYNLNERLRLHAGWLEDGKSRSMFGIDYMVDDVWTFMADTISGKDSYSYVGLAGASDRWGGFDITASLGIPHERENGYTWTVAIGYGIRL